MHNVNSFDEVFLNFFQKNRPCPEVGELEGTPSKSVDLIRFYFTDFKSFLIAFVVGMFVSYITSLIREKILKSPKKNKDRSN